MSATKLRENTGQSLSRMAGWHTLPTMRALLLFMLLLAGGLLQAVDLDQIKALSKLALQGRAVITVGSEQIFLSRVRDGAALTLPDGGTIVVECVENPDGSILIIRIRKRLPGATDEEVVLLDYLLPADFDPFSVPGLSPPVLAHIETTDDPVQGSITPVDVGGIGGGPTGGPVASQPTGPGSTLPQLSPN